MGADLQGACLRGTNLQGAILRYSNLQKANLVGVNLKGAYLGESNLQEVNLMGVNIQGTKVLEKDWIEKLEEWQVAGKDQIAYHWIVDSDAQSGIFGGHYLIKKR